MKVNLCDSACDQILVSRNEKAKKSKQEKLKILENTSEKPGTAFQRIRETRDPARINTALSEASQPAQEVPTEWAKPW